MQFTINNLQANIEHYRYKVLKNAWLIIISHKILPGETKLNNYLLNNYKLNLKTACIKLLNRCKIMRNYDNQAIIIFPDKEDDKLAALITYGNLELKGSNILKNAFFRDI